MAKAKNKSNFVLDLIKVYLICEELEANGSIYTTTGELSGIIGTYVAKISETFIVTKMNKIRREKGKYIIKELKEAIVSYLNVSKKSVAVVGANFYTLEAVGILSKFFRISGIYDTNEVLVGSTMGEYKIEPISAIQEVDVIVFFKHIKVDKAAELYINLTPKKIVDGEVNICPYNLIIESISGK